MSLSIGAGSAWWGDSVSPAALNADKGNLDYLCFETMAEATVSAAQVRNLSLDSLDLVFDIEITNPNDVSFPFLELNYAVGSGEQQLLQGGINTSATVPANGSSVNKVPARLDIAAVIQTLTIVSRGSVLPYHAEINVAVDAPLIGAINLALKHEGEIPIPTIPEISLVAFEFGEMTWEEMSATARLREKNTNQFQFDMTRIEFDLALSEERLASAGLRNASRLSPGTVGNRGYTDVVLASCIRHWYNWYIQHAARQRARSWYFRTARCRHTIWAAFDSI